VEGSPGFSTAAELRAALATPDALERRGVLARIASDPAAAIALGSDDGTDVVDALIELVDPKLDYGLREDLSIAIGAFDAPRVTDFFLARLAAAETSEEAFDAAGQLARRDLAGHRERLVAIARSDGPPERIAATAELLAGAEGLPPDVDVLVAALDDEHPPPPLDEASVNAWIELLDGPFASEARDRLAEQGPPAHAALSARTERLADDDREWLAGWGEHERVRDDRPAAAAAVAEAVEAGDIEAVSALLGGEGAAAARDALVTLGKRAIGPLRAIALDGVPEVRAGAVRALLDLGDDEWLAAALLGDHDQRPIAEDVT